MNDTIFLYINEVYDNRNDYYNRKIIKYCATTGQVYYNDKPGFGKTIGDAINDFLSKNKKWELNDDPIEYHNVKLTLSYINDKFCMVIPEYLWKKHYEKEFLGHVNNINLCNCCTIVDCDTGKKMPKGMPISISMMDVKIICVKIKHKK